jgi:prefoldin subunit 5
MGRTPEEPRMADNNNLPFAKLVPGFDFLQGLVKNAGSAMPSIGQWVAPTLNPEELEKRIEELRTVQFWLEQNARMLGATIQALEVQRMTLSTLKTMNVPLAQLRDSLKVREPAAQASAEVAAPKTARKKPARKPSPAEMATPAGAVDPMQWWGALTKQFTQLATTAMKDSAGDAAKSLAGAMVKQSFDAAEETLKKAVSTPAKVAGAVAKAAARGAESAASVASAATRRPRAAKTRSRR